MEEPQQLGINVDWVNYGAVSPVRDQGQCVASYAFAAVGAIEGISVIFFKNQVVYSVQEVIDCTFTYGNNGCQNGNMVNVYNWAANKGILQSTYPHRHQHLERLPLQGIRPELRHLIRSVQAKGLGQCHHWLHRTGQCYHRKTSLSRSRWTELPKLQDRNLLQLRYQSLLGCVVGGSHRSVLEAEELLGN